MTEEAEGGIAWPCSALWDYSLALYRHDDVEVACLALQRRHDLDVNLVLFACWLAERGVFLERETLARAREVVAPWRADIVLPLRAIRTRLADKLVHGTSEGANTARRDRLKFIRRQVLKLELDGEHLAVLALDELGQGLDATDEPGLELAARNLACLGGFGPEDREDLSALLRKAFPSAAAEDLANAFRQIVG